MTKKEKAIVRKCIDLLMIEDGGDFPLAIYELGKLCGVKYPAGDPSGESKPATVIDLCKKESPFKESPFKVHKWQGIIKP